MACPNYGTSVISVECLDNNSKLETNDKVSLTSIEEFLIKHEQDKANLSVFKDLYT